ncbi:hypothetical protein KCU90_g30, partial [Aureobasidium melanogenum]
MEFERVFQSILFKSPRVRASKVEGYAAHVSFGWHLAHSSMTFRIPDASHLPILTTPSAYLDGHHIVYTFQQTCEDLEGNDPVDLCGPLPRLEFLLGSTPSEYKSLLITAVNSCNHRDFGRPCVRKTHDVDVSGQRIDGFCARASSSYRRAR